MSKRVKKTFSNEQLGMKVCEVLEISNKMQLRVFNYTTVKSKLFPHPNMRKYFGRLQMGKPKIHILSTLLVAEVRERLVVSKQTSHIFHLDTFSIRKLNDV
jgi:hypothetical protein